MRAACHFFKFTTEEGLFLSHWLLRPSVDRNLRSGAASAESSGRMDGWMEGGGDGENNGQLELEQIGDRQEGRLQGVPERERGIFRQAILLNCLLICLSIRNCIWNDL